MATDLRAIMRRDQRRQRMIRDPDLTGDALLFALVLDENNTTAKDPRRRSFGQGTDWIDQVGALARGELPREAMRRFWVQQVIAKDVPRYEPARGAESPSCVAPMVRREGLCGKPSTRRLIDHDPQTGDAAWIGLCSRHRHWDAHYEKRRQEWIANGAPSPPPNVGGVLMRYFNADWEAVYRWAAPHLKPARGPDEPTPPRPQLRLVR